jgi:hypothetical protein
LCVSSDVELKLALRQAVASFRALWKFGTVAGALVGRFVGESSSS